MAKRPQQPYSGSNDHLVRYGLKPAMIWLVETALGGTTMTYGELKLRLEREAGFSKVFTPRIGFVAGELMNKIQKIEPSAPLLNVIVVNQSDRQPSEGAGAFMAARFHNPKLEAKDYKKRNPKEWQSYFNRAASEVYAYKAHQWSDLCSRVFGHQIYESEIWLHREKRQYGSEYDYGAGNDKYGSGGESLHHRSLRLWIAANPQKLNPAFVGSRTETEHYLESGDRVDVLYYTDTKTVVVEVKSRISDLVDLRRGVFQCIKYRAVKAAMDVRKGSPIEAFLVTETKIPGEIVALLKQHNIAHFRAPMDRD